LCPTKKRAVVWTQYFLNRSMDRVGEGPGPPYSGEKSQLEPSRDWENMRRNGGESIPDVMKEDLQPKE
jgi:hypothetical protein